jgi:Flp pilus assembly protein TadG
MSLKSAVLNASPPWLRRFAEGEKFLKDERGVAAIEFALVLPVVLLILLGCFEVPRFVLIYQKLARTASGVADLVAQGDEPLQKNQMNDIFIAGKVMMQPYDVIANGKIIVSSINNPSPSCSGSTGVKVTWQKDNGGNAKDPVTGNPSGSRVGTKCQTPVLPATLMPGTNEEVLAAEVYFNYTPIFANLIYKGSQLYQIAYTRPRNKNLMTEPPTTCTPPATQC